MFHRISRGLTRRQALRVHHFNRGYRKRGDDRAGRFALPLQSSHGGGDGGQAFAAVVGFAGRPTAGQVDESAVVALDRPTSWSMATGETDAFTTRMFEAVNAMLLDMLAAVARKDYDDRRRRQAEGQARAKAEGRYKGRAEDVARNAGISRMLGAGMSWSTISTTTGASCATIAKVAKRIRLADQASEISRV